MNTTALLAQPHLSFLTGQLDGELALIQQQLDHHVLIDGRVDLEAALGTLLANRTAPRMARTLDLIAHSTPGKALLWLGNWVIDASNPTVTAFFRELADLEVLPRLGVTALRLLGCRTAETSAGRSTILALADILGLEVFGTTSLIYSAHYDRGGFADERRYALVGSSELAADAEPPREIAKIERWPQVLDIDNLPSTADLTLSGGWSHRLATDADMAEVLRFVRRREGAQMPGLLAAPHVELVFPGHLPGTYRRAQVVLDGEFVKFYPRGAHEAGIVFAVDSPHALLETVDALPLFIR